MGSSYTELHIWLILYIVAGVLSLVFILGYYMIFLGSMINGFFRKMPLDRVLFRQQWGHFYVFTHNIGVIALVVSIGLGTMVSTYLGTQDIPIVEDNKFIFIQKKTDMVMMAKNCEITPYTYLEHRLRVGRLLAAGTDIGVAILSSLVGFFVYLDAKTKSNAVCLACLLLVFVMKFVALLLVSLKNYGIQTYTVLANAFLAASTVAPNFHNLSTNIVERNDIENPLPTQTLQSPSALPTQPLQSPSVTAGSNSSITITINQTDTTTPAPNTVIAENLIENGAVIAVRKKKNLNALHCAALNDDKEMMQSLLSKEEVKPLLDSEPDPNSPVDTPLMLCVLFKSHECLELLLKAGSNPNHRSYGKTPLLVAVFERDMTTIKQLLNARASPDVVDNTGMTPIEHAALSGNVAVVQELFPHTTKILSFPDWSVDGIMKHVNSMSMMAQRGVSLKNDFHVSKAKGQEALEKKDYEEAIWWYSQANLADETDETVLSDRSLCWEMSDEGDIALADAMDCVALKPDLSLGDCGMCAAWKLLTMNIRRNIKHILQSSEARP